MLDKIDECSETNGSDKPTGKTMFDFLNEFGFNLKPVMLDGSEPPEGTFPRYESKEEWGRQVFVDLLKTDPNLIDELMAHNASAKSDTGPNIRRKLTVTEARKRVMAHTGQSERAVIRDTRGWDAARIIALIA
ncbi:hypothetical protein [Methylorubrum thiocyanatum]|uniref:hypothetical protein n=1 Tax=Methylorubrum thiocyanatum TaxID=47958 RepID=UPI00364FEF9F